MEHESNKKKAFAYGDVYNLQASAEPSQTLKRLHQ
jgi:hypothetical protein